MLTRRINFSNRSNLSSSVISCAKHESRSAYAVFAQRAYGLRCVFTEPYSNFSAPRTMVIVSPTSGVGICRRTLHLHCLQNMLQWRKANAVQKIRRHTHCWRLNSANGLTSRNVAVLRHASHNVPACFCGPASTVSVQVPEHGMLPIQASAVPHMLHH